MGSSNHKRWLWTLFLLTMILGVTVGGVAGGVVGYLAAGQTGEPAPVSVLQPGQPSDMTLPAPEPEVESPPPADVQPEAETPPITEAPVAPAPQPEPAAPSVEGGSSIVSAVQRVQPATVQVLTPVGSGSGVVISEDGYVVTNNHVVEGAREYMVVFDRGERVRAELVGTAPDFDLAVLKVADAVPAVASWGDSSAVPLGGQVIAIGSALGDYQNTITTGILSGVNRSLGGLDGLLQHDAAINHGNSGGPLINQSGEVVGINTMVIRGGRSQAEGLGFAIPSNVAQAVVGQLIENGVAYRPLMGVSLMPVNSQLAEEFGLSVTDGAYIEQVTPGGPSAQAGIQPGDVVTAINGRPVNARDTLQMHVLSHASGETIRVSILRAGQPLELQVTLARQVS
ncbi:MAG: S1C family serine protease [Ardenticatenaceae bacterium]